MHRSERTARARRTDGNNRTIEKTRQAPAQFAEAVQLHQAGRLAEAIALYEQILLRSPVAAAAHHNRGVALACLGRFEESLLAYRSAIALKPDYAEAHTGLGMALCELGKHREAEEEFRRTISLNPGSPKPHANLGIALKCQGRFSEAEAQQRAAIAIDPSAPDFYGNLADVLCCLSRLNDAEHVLRHAIALQPRFAEAFAKLGNILRELGRFAESETVCRQALALEPDHPGALSALGCALVEQGKLTEAEVCFRRAIALNPKFAAAHNNLGSVFKQLGRIEQAQQAIEQSLRVPPRDALRYLNLSEVRRFTADDPFLAEMEAYGRESVSLPVKEQIELHFALAKAYDDLGRHADSFKYMAAGNALKRRQIRYDEAETLGLLSRTRRVFSSELIRGFDNCGEPAAAPIFIVGMPRSGTTLVEQIIASHPRVFGGGELSDLYRVVTEVLSESCAAEQFPEAVFKVTHDELRQIGTRYTEGILSLAPSTHHITHKMPSNFLFAGLIHLALPNARIIHVSRDAADVCLSCFSKLFVAGQLFTYDLAELGRYYRHYAALMAHWRKVLPQERILDVRYEDLVADPERSIRRILDHCALDWDERCLAFHENARPVSTASAVQVRQPIYRHAVKRAEAYAPFLQPLFAELTQSPAD